MSEDLAHDQMSEDHAGEGARGEHRIGLAKASLAHAPRDVVGDEGAKAPETHVLERPRHLVAFERRVEQQAEKRRIRLDAPQHRQRETDEHRVVVSGARGRLERREQIRRTDPLIEDRGVDRLLAREVAIERGLGDADCGRDVARRGAAKAARAEALPPRRGGSGRVARARQSLAALPRGGRNRSGRGGTRDRGALRGGVLHRRRGMGGDACGH